MRFTGFWAVRVARDAVENSLKECARDRHAAYVDLAGLSKLFERGVALSIPCMGRAFVPCIETDANAPVIITRQPVNMYRTSYQRASQVPACCCPAHRVNHQPESDNSSALTRDLLQLSGLRPRPELRDLAERFGVLP